MKTSNEITKIAPALAKVQGKLKDLFKGTKGYGYSYATLDNVLKEIRNVNQKEGLFFTQNLTIEEEIIKIETTIFHESGEYLQFETNFPFAKLKGMNDYQSAGSGFTYARRYVLSAIFGIASDEDKDAHGEQDNKAKKETEKSKKEISSFKRKLIELTENKKEHNDLVMELLAGKKADDIQEKDQDTFLEKVARALSLMNNNNNGNLPL